MEAKRNELLSVSETAKLLGITRGRVLFYIRQKRLAAEKIGGFYAIPAEAVKQFTRFPVGRPSQKNK